MRNKFVRGFKKYNKQSLSASFYKQNAYKPIGTDIDCVTLDEALELIDKKTKAEEKRVATRNANGNGKGCGIKTLKQLFALSKTESCTKRSKKKLALPKLSIQIDKEY